MQGLPWPNSAGYWSNGGQQYFARACNSKGDYEVRDCRNLDVACYQNKEHFYTFYRDRQPFPWFPCTLTIHDGRDEQMNYPPGPYVLLKNVKEAICNFPPAYREVVNNFPKYNLPDSQAEELLTKVCEYIIDVKEDWNTDPQGKALRFLSHIPGLAEWWTKHKPKSEREQKLEKITDLLSKTTDIPQDKRAKLILEALEQ